MNKISYLLSGILIGLFISHLLNRPAAKTVLSEVGGEVETQNIEKPKQNVAAIKSAKVVSIKQLEKPKINDSETVRYRPSESSNEAALAEEPKNKQQLELIITEELVHQLEKNWYDLPRQARLQIENGGWRVSFVEDNSLFAKTGLQSGDFISRQAIQNLTFENSQDANLPNRVMRILTHIQ